MTEDVEQARSSHVWDRSALGRATGLSSDTTAWEAFGLSTLATTAAATTGVAACTRKSSLCERAPLPPRLVLPDLARRNKSLIRESVTELLQATRRDKMASRYALTQLLVNLLCTMEEWPLEWCRPCREHNKAMYTAKQTYRKSVSAILYTPEITCMSRNTLEECQLCNGQSLMHHDPNSRPGLMSGL